MLVVRKIENTPTGPNNRPKLAVRITGEYDAPVDVIDLIDSN